MNALKALGSFLAAFLIADLIGTIILGVCSLWLLSPYTSDEVALHIFVTVAALAAAFTTLSAIFQFLGMKAWLAAILLAGVATLALLGLRGAVTDLTPREVAMVIAALFVPFSVATAAISYCYSKTLRKLGSL